MSIRTTAASLCICGISGVASTVWYFRTPIAGGEVASRRMQGPKTIKPRLGSSNILPTNMEGKELDVPEVRVEAKEPLVVPKEPERVEPTPPKVEKQKVKSIFDGTCWIFG